LVGYCQQNLFSAWLTGNTSLAAAMTLNLERLAEAAIKALPDKKIVLDPWQRAIADLGAIVHPEPDRRPHPHADSLSRIICTLRDDGPKLPFRELFAPFDGAIHIVRPA
jgi:hypothetical protein